jgi:hypothetical protein
MLDKPSYPAVKGVFLVGLAKVLRFRRAEAMEIVAPHLRKYFVHHISPAFWYPEEDYVALADAVAKLHPHIDDPYGMLGATGARVYVATANIYRSMLVERQATWLLRKAQKYWPLYHNTGRVVFSLETPTSGSFDIIDYAMASANICRVNESFYAEEMTLLGVSLLRFEKILCKGAGDRCCRWQVALQTAEA